MTRVSERAALDSTSPSRSGVSKEGVLPAASAPSRPSLVKNLSNGSAVMRFEFSPAQKFGPIGFRGSRHSWGAGDVAVEMLVFCTPSSGTKTRISSLTCHSSDSPWWDDEFDPLLPVFPWLAAEM